MTYRGRVENGVIVLEPDARLPEGTLVTVQPLAMPAEAGPETDALSRMGDLAAETGVTDLATNVDHYLYGHPKVTDGQ